MSVYSSFNLRYEVHNDQDEELNGIVTKLTELVEQGETLKSDRRLVLPECVFTTGI